MDKQHIILEYDKYKKIYSEKYGPDTIILMQLGSFYELCAVLENKEKFGELNIYHICDNILNINIAKKKNKISKKSIPSEDDISYLQAGFPLISKDKFVPILLEHNYTIVIVDQITGPPNPEREVTEILSPGTCIRENKIYNNFLMSIYIEKYSINDKFNIGISTIDVSTGKNYYHYLIENNDSNYWIDEISRLLNFYEPSEIIIHTNNFIIDKDYCINLWDIKHNSIHINHFNDPIHKKPSYQNKFLNEIFKLNNMIDPLELFDMTYKQEVSLSYIYMLLYIKNHKSDILNNIDQPKEYIKNKYLLLNSNSIRQLNIVNNYSYYKGKNESLYEICNICNTSMGRRLLKNRLLYPLIDVDEINLRYDKIEYIKSNYLYNDIIKNLSSISDIEKSLRLLGLNKLIPYDIYSSRLSYTYVNNIFKQIKSDNKLHKFYDKYDKSIDEFKNFLDTIDKLFDFDNIRNVPINQLISSIFNNGIYIDLDSVNNDIITTQSEIDTICKYLSCIIDSKNDNCIKYSFDKDKDWYFYCTNKRAETFKKKLKNMPDKLKKTKFKFSKSEFNYKKYDKNNTIIDHPEIKKLSIKIKNLYKELEKLNNRYFTKTTIDIYNKYNKILKDVNYIISDIDFCCVGAKLSIDNNYCRPNIINSEKSFIDVKKIRHPIVEKINNKTEYITNDIIIGNKQDGILLFGTNACGKSTFMKAVGLNIVLAQAGLYVAAEKFDYYPYQQVFTRILNNDNIFRSQSSFAVEIEELRSILKRTCSNSLVLGDELCSGTETNSALSIVCAGLYQLSEKKSSFIFTSHLHQLNDISIIKNINNLSVYHLKIIYENNILIYDRKLEKGPGPSVYGLKVCEALGMSDEFIKLANSVQSEINDTETSLKISPYNNDVIVDKCNICDNIAKETHHIKEQNTADSHGNIDHFHKNIKHNLVPLCKDCHKKTTYGNLIIDGWIQTSEGIKLKYEYINKNKSKKKYSEKQQLIIKKYKINYDDNISNCVKILSSKENIKISKQTLKKIMEDKY